jgi:hypothetical protein
MVWPMPFHESLAALDADGGRRNKWRGQYAAERSNLAKSGDQG